VSEARETAFQAALRRAPARPGCYLFCDASGEVLYVGKAKNLRNRVQVYRRDGADGRLRFAELLQQADRAEFRVTDTEVEAVLLEERLVKLHMPPLNVLLKDDKSFLLVHIDTNHAWPRIGLARKRRRRQGEFYGPYPNGGAARRAKRLLQKAFGLRDCSDHTLANRRRPCLKHEVGLCSAPCVDRVSEADYSEALDGARAVLTGHVQVRLRIEEERMAEASANMDYEIALRARDRSRALQALAAPQRVRLEADRDFDVLGIDERGHFALLEYRDGDWVGTRHGRVPVVEAPAEMVSELLPALYRGGAEVPPEILVPALPEESEAIRSWLRKRASHAVSLHAPARGEKRALVRLAESNARARQGEVGRAPWPTVAQRIADLTHLPAPAVIDCIDVSHLQGKERVASKVRFVEGKPDRASYRRYIVGTGEGNDDFAAMHEIVTRVLARRGEDGIADLIVLDGGKGQLNAGLEAAREDGRRDVPLIALAKARKGRGPVAAEERIFIPGRPDAIILEPRTPERLFFERIRDEAHRFAITHHRNRRENLRLVLEQIPGIGPARRKALLDWCAGDLSKLRDAPREILLEMPGMTADLIDSLQSHLYEVLP
jgi:excinuclease ABC subunit C